MWQRFVLVLLAVLLIAAALAVFLLIPDEPEILLDEDWVAVRLTTIPQDTVGKSREDPSEPRYRQIYYRRGIVFVSSDRVGKRSVGTSIDLSEISDYQGTGTVIGTPVQLEASDTLIPLTSTGNIVVRFLQPQDPEQIHRFNATYNTIEVTRYRQLDGFHLFRTKQRESREIRRLVERIADDDRVAHASPDVYLPIELLCEDCSPDWHFTQMGVTGDPPPERQVTVAVIDQGFDSQGLDSLDATVFPLFSTAAPHAHDVRHGMAIAGILGSSEYGICKTCRLILLTVPDSYEEALQVLDEMLTLVEEQSVAVVVSGWGIPYPLEVVERLSPGLPEAFGRVAQQIPTFFAAGNADNGIVDFPASHPDVFGIGTSDCTGRFACVTSRCSPDLHLLVAPGGDEGCGLRTIGYENAPGFRKTSAAAPIAAGIAARMRAVNPDLTVEDIRRILFKGERVTAEHCAPCSGGQPAQLTLLDAAQALEDARP